MPSSVELDTTRTWIAVLGIASLLHFALLLTFGWLGWRFTRRGRRRFAELQARHIQPLMHQVETVVAETRDVGARLQRAKTDTQDALRHVADTTRVIAHVVRYRALPAWVVLRGLRVFLRRRSGVRTPTSPSRTRSASTHRPPARAPEQSRA